MALNKDNFHNYKNKSKEFDTFNGTELKFFMKVPTKYNEYNQVIKFELVELGQASSFSYIEQYAIEPVPVIGLSGAGGIARGSRIIRGSLVFEVLKEGFVNEVKSILKKAGIKQVEVNYDANGKDYTPKYSLTDIESVNDFPNFDIIMLGVKDNNPNKKIQKQIQGLRFSQGQSGIGVNQLSVREQYAFLAKSIEDLNIVTGSTETDIGDEEYYSWDGGVNP